MLPLVPQHVQKRRRLAEIIDNHGNHHNITNGAHAFLYRDRPRPSRYPRRQARQLITDSRSNRAAHEDDDLHHHRRRRRRLAESKNHASAAAAAAADQQVVSLFQGYGTHFVDLWVGSPPQRQTLIVDTGSATTAFPCRACTRERCGRVASYHTDGPFQEQLSTTFAAVQCGDCFLGECKSANEDANEQEDKKAQCTFGVTYQEGSNWTAFEAIDQVYVGGMHTQALPLEQQQQQHQHSKDGLDPLAATEYTFPLRFGCQTQMTGHFRTQLEDGIVGMDIGRPAIWNQMYLQGKIGARAFSLCFQRQPAKHAAGALTLGGTDPRLHNDNHPMVYAARATGGEEGAVFFSVRLRRVYLREGAVGASDSVMSRYKAQDDSGNNGDLLKIVPVDTEDLSRDNSEGLVIIDSGTTDTYLTHLLQEPFQQAWRELTEGPGYHNKPVSVANEEDLHRLPTILLQLQGDVDSNHQVQEKNTIPLPLAGDLDPDHPHDILLAVPPSHYMEYQPDSRTYVAGFYFDEPEGSVLGANSMMLHDILFDVEHDRIGWAESTCEYNTLVAPFLEKEHVKDDRLYQAPNPRMRGPPGKSRNKIVANQEAVAVPVDDGMKIPSNSNWRWSMSSSYCSSPVCRISLAMVSVLLALGAVVATFQKRRKKRRGRNAPWSSVSMSSILPSTSLSVSNHNGTSLPMRKPRRGGKRRSSNLQRSTSEAIPRSAMVRGEASPASAALSSDDGTSSAEDSIPSVPQRFSRGQLLRSRSHCHHFGV